MTEKIDCEQIADDLRPAEKIIREVRETMRQWCIKRYGQYPPPKRNPEELEAAWRT